MTRQALRALLFLCLAAGGAAAQQDPAPAPTAAELRERAAAAENAGRYADAADALLQLVAQEPGRGQWVLDAGRCLGLAGRFNDAIDLLTQKRATFPGLLEIPALLARTHLLRVERDPGVLNPELAYADAVQLANEVLELAPDHEDARLLLAQARYAQGDADAARAAAEEAVRRHPQRAGAHVLMGRIAYDQFAAQKRIVDGDTLTPAQRELLLPALDRARDDAVKAFRRAAEIDGTRAFPHVMLGQIGAVERDVAMVLQEWGAALALDPTVRVDHGWIAAHTEPAARAAFYRDARDTYLRCPGALAARAATLQFYEGLAHYAAIEWQPALELFAACKRDNPDYTSADYYAAMCAWRLGDQDGAELHASNYAAASAVGFADVLRELSPQDRTEVADLVRSLGDRAYAAGRIDRSRDLNHVIACLLDSADAWNNYAFLCRETSRFDDAFAGYQHAIEKEPGSPQLWNDAAVILQYHQATPANVQKAREMYDHALALAEQVLGDAASTELQRRRAEKARDDARRNLAELPK